MGWFAWCRREAVLGCAAIGGRFEAAAPRASSRATARAAAGRCRSSLVFVLSGAEPAADGSGGDLAGPLPVGAVQPGRVGAAGAVGWPQRVSRWVMSRAAPCGWRRRWRPARRRSAGPGPGGWRPTRTGSGWHWGGDPGHVLGPYIYSMNARALTAMLVDPSSASAEAASVRPACPPRARAARPGFTLLWAAGKLAGYGIGWGWSRAGRAASPVGDGVSDRAAPGLSGLARRTCA